MDADEERESHLHTARIRGRIKDVEAFLGAWKELAKAAAASRKKGQASEAEETEFAKLRTTIHKQYAGILRRLGNPGAPGQRVVSACETGVTLNSIVQMADADFQDLSSHFQTGAKLLFDYVAFLEEGRQDLLKQSTFYFYWDKIMHNTMAAAIAGLAAVMLLSVIGWQVVKRLPKGKATPAAKEATPEAIATEDDASDEAPAETVVPAKTTATEAPAVAAEPVLAEEADLMALEPAYPGFFPIGVWQVSIDAKQFEADKEAELSRIKQEIELMKSIGINTVVSNVYAPDGEPHIATLAKELGVRMVGNSSGLSQIYDSEQPVDRSGVQRTVAQDAERLKAHPHLFECLVWLGDPKPHFTPNMWKQMAEAAMASDPPRPPQFVYSDAERAAAYWAAHPLPSIHAYIYPFKQGGTSAWAIQKAIQHFGSFHRLAPKASHFAFLQAFGARKPYRVPTRAELRGLSNVALAHGVKGVFLFCWWYPSPGVGLTDGSGQLAELASEVTRLSQTVDRIGPVLLRLSLGPSLTTAQGNALGTTLISKADHQYAFIVNLDVEESASVRTAVTPVAGKALARVRDVLTGTVVEASVTATQLTFATRLEPGEGRLFRILHGAGAPATPRPLANALVVKQDGSGDFADLATAIKAAKPGHVVEIADTGRYSIPGECTVPCALRGSPGRRPTIVLTKKTRLTFQPGSRLENVTLEGEKHAFAYGGSFERVKFATPAGLAFRVLPNSQKEQTLTIRNCLFTVPRVVVDFLGSPENRPVKVLFEHNTVIDAGGIYITGQAVLIEAKGNVFAGINTLVWCEPQRASPEPNCGKCTFIGTHNCYHRLEKFMISRGATAKEKFSVESFKAWQAKTGTDADSFEDDPKFVDAANGNFRLAPDSPCRGKGLEGRDVGIQWDEWDGAKTHDAATQPESRTDHRLERVQGTSLEPVKSLVAQGAGFEGDKRYPRVIRLSNGHLLMAFDAYQPPGKPSSIIDAKIACVRSEDNGKTWVEPTMIADTEDDDRCGVLTEADDGTVLCHFYSHRLQTNWVRLRMAVSNDYGKTWSLATQWLSGDPLRACTNSPAIRLANGTLILPIYTVAQSKQKLYQPALIRSQDHGKTWGDMSVIDADTGHRHCEPALVVLPDGRWLCLMRPCMCRCYSSDQGRTWTKPEKVGFRGDCPCLLRTSTGVILCAHRHPGTSLSYSLDNGAHWIGPATMDRNKGAYPSMVELPDGSILCVFRCGHDTSAIWSVRFRATDRGITWLAR